MKSLLLASLLVGMYACQSSQTLDQNARDVSASLSGLVSTAQAQHQECVADSTPQTCQVIKRGVSGENALITALETYCGWSPAGTPPAAGTQCTPVAGADAALRSAIANANQLVGEIKGTVKP